MKAGATPREVMDAAGMATMMGGGPTYIYVTMVAGALEHFEKAAVATREVASGPLPNFGCVETLARGF